MLTVGVDLAAEPARTAVAVIDWAAGGAAPRDLIPGAGDDVIVDAISTADKAGIDYPLGWPEAFIAFLSAQRAGQLVVPHVIVGQDWRRRLAYRVTERLVADGELVDRCGDG